jgi:hypothetical protein
MYLYQHFFEPFSFHYCTIPPLSQNLQCILSAAMERISSTIMMFSSSMAKLFPPLYANQHNSIIYRLHIDDNLSFK